jgi:hypothetical protein
MRSKRESGGRLVQATPARYVLDLPMGRVVIEPETIRFHRNGRGRGLTLLDDAL